MRYDTFLLDLDHTLLDFARAERDAVIRTLSAFGIGCGEEVVALYSAINDRFWKKLERGEIDRKTLQWKRFEELCSTQGYDCDPRAVSARYMEELQGCGYLLPGAEELCRTLRESGRIYFVTNGTKSVQVARLARSGLGKYADAVFISEEIGAEKPTRAYFDAVFAAIPDFCPQRTILIGDSLTSDMQGACNAGVDGCWYNPTGRPLPPTWPEDRPIAYTVSALEEIPALIEPGSEGSV